MKRICVFYSSVTGTTKRIALLVAAQLGLPVSDVYHTSEITESLISNYDLLILGTSTWGMGELNDDWSTAVQRLRKMNLRGKEIAIFGSGDSVAYSDVFCEAIGIIYYALKWTGAKFIGEVAEDGYHFDSSLAIVGSSFVGLPLDEENEPELTDTRVANWVTQLV